LRNLKLLIEYDGTQYGGWQRQDNSRTIQGEIESVLNQVLQERITLSGAGRTDAGVHARGQVANFKTDTGLAPRELHGALNGLLPKDIVVHEVAEVPENFHARYSARERFYSYRITSRRTALLRQYSWYVKYQLDLSLMQAAAGLLLGTHDFESFCKAQSDVDHHRCTVVNSDWKMEKDFFIFSISADRFLHGMVRALVGTMVDVGRGFIGVEEFLEIIDQRNRTKAGMAAPPQGLVLETIIY
jgi:tRNA pseudouridine38-40 synthase